MLTGKIQGTNPDGTVNVLIDQTGQTVTRDGFSFGNSTTGFQYGPSVGDQVYIDTISNVYNVVVGAKVPHLSNGRINAQGVLVPLLEGEAIFYFKAGQQLFFDANGNVEITPSRSGHVVLNTLNLNLKAVACLGDTVTVQGPSGPMTGTITSTHQQIVVA